MTFITFNITSPASCMFYINRIILAAWKVKQTQGRQPANHQANR